MATPFFSVIVPTRNRRQLLKNAIGSVLNQTFKERELLVVDNDDTSKSSEVIAGFPDPRVKHLRTGGLSMPDNWEHGGSRAMGEYMLLIEDKQLLKAHALE